MVYAACAAHSTSLLPTLLPTRWWRGIDMPGTTAALGEECYMQGGLKGAMTGFGPALGNFGFTPRLSGTVGVHRSCAPTQIEWVATDSTGYGDCCCDWEFGAPAGMGMEDLTTLYRHMHDLRHRAVRWGTADPGPGRT